MLENGRNGNHVASCRCFSLLCFSRVKVDGNFSAAMMVMMMVIMMKRDSAAAAANLRCCCCGFSLIFSTILEEELRNGGRRQNRRILLLISPSQPRCIRQLKNSSSSRIQLPSETKTTLSRLPLRRGERGAAAEAEEGLLFLTLLSIFLYSLFLLLLHPDCLLLLVLSDVREGGRKFYRFSWLRRSQRGGQQPTTTTTTMATTVIETTSSPARLVMTTFSRRRGGGGGSWV